MTYNNGRYTLDSGQTFDESMEICGNVIGIDPAGMLYYGHDGMLQHLCLLTPTEREEIATYMIQLWMGVLTDARDEISHGL